MTGLAKLRSSAYSDHTLLAHLASHATAVIFDEAHQAVAETYSFVTEQLCSTRPPLLGLTATPGRTSKMTDSDYRLAHMFNQTKVSIDPRGHDSPVTYLIQNQYLADPRFVPISFDSDIAVMEPEPGMDYTKDELDSLGRNEDRTSKIVELAKNAAARHPRTIVFRPSVESAIQCNRLLRSQGVVSQVVTARTHSEERRTIIDAFRGR